MFDNKIRKKFNVKIIAGVDEVGRGCLSGPVVASAVVFNDKVYIPHLKESKSTTPYERIVLFKEILRVADAVSISIVNVTQINKIGLQNSCFVAAKNAVMGLKLQPELVVVDGFYNPLITDVKQLSVIKGDKKSAVVAAASIIAKVVRDKIMTIYHSIVPQYDFLKNKGYPTKYHMLQLTKFGLSELHRCYAYKFCVR